MNKDYLRPDAFNIALEKKVVLLYVLSKTNRLCRKILCKLQSVH